MKLQKFILCVVIALTAFGASLGLLEIGAYIRTAFQPLKVEIKPIQPPVIAMPATPNFAPPSYTPPAESEPVEEAEPEVWGNTGDYYIVDEKPKGFEDFETLAIIDRQWDEKAEKVVSIKPEGQIGIWLEKQEKIKEFSYSRINITGKRLSLATQTKKGVSYQFDGKFVEQEITLEDENGEEYTVTVYLKGRLSKWRDGKKIAEAKVRFSISHGC